MPPEQSTTSPASLTSLPIPAAPWTELRAAHRPSWPHVADPTTSRPRGGRYFIYRPPWTVDGTPSTPRGGRRRRDRRKEPPPSPLPHCACPRRFRARVPGAAKPRSAACELSTDGGLPAWTEIPLPGGRVRQKPLVFRACTGHGGHEAGWRRGPGLSEHASTASLDGPARPRWLPIRWTTNVERLGAASVAPRSPCSGTSTAAARGSPRRLQLGGGLSRAAQEGWLMNC